MARSGIAWKTCPIVSSQEATARMAQVVPRHAGVVTRGATDRRRAPDGRSLDDEGAPHPRSGMTRNRAQVLELAALLEGDRERRRRPGLQLLGHLAVDLEVVLERAPVRDLEGHDALRR